MDLASASALIDRAVADADRRGAAGTGALLDRVAADGATALRLGTRLLSDPGPAARAVGCRLLRRAGGLHEEVRAPAATALLAHLPAEADRTVRRLAVAALGATQDERAVAQLVSLAEDVDPEVREAVARSLASVAPELPGDPEVPALIRLTTDPEPEVRNWATFALGFQLEVDTPAVRAALWARAGDSYHQARAEGVRGLAVRHDPRAVRPLGELLAWSGGDPLTLRAAAVLGAAELLPGLRALDPATPGLAEALASCDPVARAALDRQAWSLVETLQPLLPDAAVSVTSDRFEPGLTLTVGTAHSTLSWSVEPLLARAGGAVGRAAALAAEDVEEDAHLSPPAGSADRA
ncbi:HEAT repeat domain-containing protein [Kitasatospora sp. NPDC049258]|uniref:HEAT repeat domain-containing protein n=1 Tax=Kitasatospora sp. NPDC049258 TaxID=3155394 RepID=UPI003447BA6A